MCVRTRSFERWFGCNWSRALLHRPSFCVINLFALPFPPFIHIMEDSISSQPFATSAVIDGQPTGGTHSCASCLLPWGSREPVPAKALVSLFVSFCFVFSSYTLSLCTECDTYGWALSLQYAVNCRIQCNANRVKGWQLEPHKLR